jgi:hypothetical protein
MQRQASRLFLAAAVCLTAWAGCEGAPPTEDGAPAQTELGIVAPTTFTVGFPAGASLQKTILSATGTLLIDSRAVVGSGAPPFEVASFGTQATQIAANARVNGDVLSVPPVSIGSAAAVTGVVKSGGAITAQAGASVLGGSTANTTVRQTTFSWTATIPTTNGGPINLFAGQSGAPAPGSFGAVTAFSNAKLSLKTGTYFFASLDSEPGSTINLDETAGPIFIYVTGAVVIRGNLVASGGTGTNLLLVSLGTGVVDVATPLSGTIVALNGTVNLDQPSGNKPHVGQVFAKKIELFSSATLDFGAFDWNFFCPRGDTDGDGVSDCQDACPIDPKKTTPGVCGCGNAETDTDGDGLPNCVDFCPNDPAKAIPGQCGCAGSPRPAGTTCSDGICAGVTARAFTCNGAGQCGDPNACSPDPGHCVAKVYRDNIYWICAGATSWAQADTNCASVPGQSLARIDNREEDQLVADLISGPTWLGGNDQSLAGTWRWAAGTNLNGDIFFAAGAPVAGSYTNWAAGSPADNAGKCSAILNGSGQWIDQSCTKPLAYICKRSALVNAGPTIPPIACGDFSPNLSCPPPITNCVATDPFLTETADQVKAELNNCLAANCTQDGDPGCAQCTGAASVPPVGSTCTPTGGTPCGITNPHGTCKHNADCAAGEICEVPLDCTVCDANHNCTTVCPPNTLECGTPTPGCSPPTDGTERCQEVNICAPPGSSGDPNPFNDPMTNLTPTVFDPAKEFTPAAAPVPAYPADPACASPPCVLGHDHPWCKYIVDNPLTPQNPNDNNDKQGDSGGGGLIQFDFDPSLTLSFDPTAIFAMGESEFHLIAAAEFSAGATFNILGSSTFTLIDAEASLQVTRCRAWTTDSKLELFGFDFLPSLLPEVKFDTNADVGDNLKTFDDQACEDALAGYVTLFHRAKKAMKDAQELLTQYNGLKAAGKTISVSLCQQIVSDPPFNFPAGNCATDSPEATINRFIKYYESELTAAMSQEVQLATQELTLAKHVDMNITDQEEDQTILATTFFIGPIPVNLDLEAIEHYGVNGGLDFTLNPGSLIQNTGSPEHLASATGVVVPYANAGVSLSLGVGFDFDVISLTAGVEGIVTLGNVQVPIHAGAGIDVQAAPDTRPFPADLVAVSSSVPILTPVQYQFMLFFDYGLEVDINQILAGQLNLRVHVSFLFFSKTWRLTLVSFPGFSLPPLVLLKGQSGDIALGSVPWGTLQMPNPFLTLNRLSVPTTAPAPTVQQVAADTSKVEKFFYDRECQCLDLGKDCHSNGDCCPTAPLCFSDPAGLAGAPATCATCRATTASCNQDSDCCAGNPAGCYPTADVPGAPRECTVCLEGMRTCDPNHSLCCGECLTDDPADPNSGHHCQEPPR